MRALILSSLAVVLFIPTAASAYPPAVGIAGSARTCTTCHKSNGPWKDEAATIIDILDAETRQSLRQPDGRFVLEVKRGATRKVVTVIGRQKGDRKPAPVRNAWVYVDPTRLDTTSISKFAPGWDVNLPMACRIVGDEVPEYPGAAATALAMTLRPGDAASNAVLELQVMLSKGKSAKGSPNEWLKSNYLVRKVLLRVKEP